MNGSNMVICRRRLRLTLITLNGLMTIMVILLVIKRRRLLLVRRVNVRVVWILLSDPAVKSPRRRRSLLRWLLG